jgi:hypothetical protein
LVVGIATAFLATVGVRRTVVTGVSIAFLSIGIAFLSDRIAFLSVSIAFLSVSIDFLSVSIAFFSVSAASVVRARNIEWLVKGQAEPKPHPASEGPTVTKGELS